MSIEPKTNTRFRIPLPKKKFLIYGIIAVLVIAGISVKSLMPLEGQVLTVQPGEFTKGFTEEAEVLAADEWPIYNSVDGKLNSISVKNGDTVAKGQVLLTLDTSDLGYEVDTLRAQLKSLEGQHQQSYREPYEALVKQQNLLIEQAKKNLQAEEQNVARFNALYEQGALPLVEYEKAQLQAETAKNFLEQQKSALDLLYEQQLPAQGTDLFFSGQKDALKTQINQLENKIKKATVTAPQDGLIKDLNLKEGSFAQQGQLLLQIFKEQDYHLKCYVLASQALGIKIGDQVEVIQDTPTGEKTLTGQVISIDPSAIERISPLGLKENRVKVTLKLLDKTDVILGSTVDVRFTTKKEANQILVPKTTIFPYEDGYAVWVIREGKADIQSIVKGSDNQRFVVIKDGLNDGDQVILDAALKGLKVGKSFK